MKKRVLSVILVYAMLLYLIPAGLLSNAGEKRNDPFALMYDSKPLIENAIEEIAEEIYRDEIETMMNATISSAVELKEVITDQMKSVSTRGFEMGGLQLDKAYEKRIKRVKETFGEQRFIVKYRDVESPSIIEYLHKEDIGSFSVESRNKTANSELLVFDTIVNPKVLADMLKQRAFGQEIEYIQPDFQMSLSTTTTDIFYLEAVYEEPNTDGVAGASEEISREREAVENNEQLYNNNSQKLDAEQQNVSANPISTIDTGESTSPNDQLLSENNNVIIALIDTGVDVNHDALEGHLWESIDGTVGWNFCDDDGIVFDEDNPALAAHGTHVAGIIVEHAPEAQIMALQVFDANGAYTSDIIDAIHFAEENGATIVNCSFGGADYNPALEEAIAESDMLFITAAGNGGMDLTGNTVYPACIDLDNIVCVASANDDGGLSFYSNYSESHVDIAAYGREVESTLPEGSYGVMSGTSMAAAQVTGIAGAITRDYLLPTTELKAQLIETADRYSNLQTVVTDGRILNKENAVADRRSEDIVENNPEEESNVAWNPLPASEQYELYSATGKNIQIETTYEAVVVLKDDGTVWAWGENTDGVCGRTSSGCTEMNKITGLSRIVKIAAGDAFCLALRADGTVWAWGNNTDGVLGTGAANNVRRTPEQVVGLSEIVDIGAGYYHSFAIDKEGRLYTWGLNDDWQLGNGTTTSSELPIRLSLSNVLMAAGGEDHSLALCADGTVWAWGENENGQLGTDSVGASSVPIESKMTNAVSVAAGATHSLAIDMSGNVYAWGKNTYGQLGNNTKTTSEMPVLTELDNAAIAVAGSSKASLAIAADGTVWSWGDGADGALGTGYEDDELVPVQIQTLEDCVDVDMHSSFGVALQEDGTVWAWGNDFSNAFGTSNYPAYSEPVRITTLDEYTMLYAGKDQTIGIDEDNDAYGWGNNEEWVLGDTDESIVKIPALIDLTNIGSVDFGYDHVLAQKTNGRVYAWGQNRRGQLGDDTEDTSLYPVRAGSLTDIVQVSAGYRYSLALDSTGDVYAWGYNNVGQLASGDNTSLSYPEYITDLDDVVQIAAGRRHGLALDDAGRVWAWGENSDGQLGDGTTSDANEAFRLSYPRNVVQIDAGDYFSVALDENGDVWTWGRNSSYQLGNDDTADVTEAEVVPDIENVVKIAAGEDYCLALKSDGTVWGWGDNNSYEIGDDDGKDVTNPQKISGLSDIVHIIAGQSHCFAIDDTGCVYGWGSNYYSELGIPRESVSLTPIKVQSMQPRLSFTKDTYVVNIPVGSTSTVQLMAVGNTETTAISETMPSYHLNVDHMGVTLRDDGCLTVSSATETGRVQVTATYADMTCTAEVIFRKTTVEDAYSVKLSVMQGETYHVAFKVQNAEVLNGRSFAISYDPTLLQVEDLCALTFDNEVAVGTIARTGIYITSVTNGEIQFTLTKTIPAGEKWSGLVNLFTFKAVADGEAIVRLL